MQNEDLEGNVKGSFLGRGPQKIGCRVLEHKRAVCPVDKFGGGAVYTFTMGAVGMHVVSVRVVQSE